MIVQILLIYKVHVLTVIGVEVNKKFTLKNFTNYLKNKPGFKKCLFGCIASEACNVCRECINENCGQLKYIFILLRFLRVQIT